MVRVINGSSKLGQASSKSADQKGRSNRRGRLPIDLVESGGGMWKISSLPAISYCLEAGAYIRRLAGVSGGGLIAGLLAVGATPQEIVSKLAQVHNINIFDAFQIPIRLREVFPDRLTIKNTAGRLPKYRDIRLGEIDSELSIVCARLGVTGTVLDALRRIGGNFTGLTFRSIVSAATEFSALLLNLRTQETMQDVVEGADLVVLSSQLTPDVSVIDAMAASCAFFVSYQINGEELHDGFYFSNLPTRVVLKPRSKPVILAHQTDPFFGESWTSWFLHKIFNKETIEQLQQRCGEDEDLASQHGVLLRPRVQEITSPFSAVLSPDLLMAGQQALNIQQYHIDRILLKRYKENQQE